MTGTRVQDSLGSGRIPNPRLRFSATKPSELDISAVDEAGSVSAASKYVAISAAESSACSNKGQEVRSCARELLDDENP